MGDFQLFLERLSGLILGDFGAKMGGFKRFFELDAHFSFSPENRLNFIGYQ